MQFQRLSVADGYPVGRIHELRRRHATWSSDVGACCRRRLIGIEINSHLQALRSCARVANRAKPRRPANQACLNCQTRCLVGSRPAASVQRDAAKSKTPPAVLKGGLSLIAVSLGVGPGSRCSDTVVGCYLASNRPHQKAVAHCEAAIGGLL